MSQNLISIKTKKHKSLGVLTILFVKLFLLNGPEISLEDVASSIFEEDDDGLPLFKSKGRRLYDIANVLTSLGLIRKCKNSRNKNVFRWIGSRGFTLEGRNSG
jgi:transcription factor E2F7/8